MHSDAPLGGVRVLDFTRLLPGPVCTLYCADLGADVIKIEEPLAGDPARALGAQHGETSALFRSVNRGKRSLAVDLKSTRGRDCVIAVAMRADVVVEGFRPGLMAALGLDAATLLTVNPRLVYASISGHGQTGPRANEAGHDINYLAYTGALDQTGTAGGPPALSNLQVADLLGGAASTAIAVMAALVAVARTGRGRYIDVAMTDATLAHQHFAMQGLARNGRALPRGEDLLSGGVPAYGVYATCDARFVAVGALEERFWRRLCTVLGRDDLAPLGLATGADGERARDALSAVFAAQPLALWRATFAGADCCVTPVATLDEALADPQFHARGMVGMRGDGTHWLAPPWAVDADARIGSRAPPRKGEHSREILGEAGYDARAIDALVDAGIVAIS